MAIALLDHYSRPVEYNTSLANIAVIAVMLSVIVDSEISVFYKLMQN